VFLKPFKSYTKTHSDKSNCYDETDLRHHRKYQILLLIIQSTSNKREKSSWIKTNLIDYYAVFQVFKYARNLCQHSGK